MKQSGTGLLLVQHQGESQRWVLHTRLSQYDQPAVEHWLPYFLYNRWFSYTLRLTGDFVLPVQHQWQDEALMLFT